MISMQAKMPGNKPASIAALAILFFMVLGMLMGVISWLLS